MRRQLWIARVNAIAVGNMLAESLGGMSGAVQMSAAGRPYREASLDGFMAGMGAKWE